MKSKKELKNETIKYMTALGNYKPEYDHMIDTYVSTKYQLDAKTEEWEETGAKVVEEYTNKAGATNMRKVPILTVIENLRKDFITLSDKLMLNPKSDSVELEPESNKNNLLNDFLQNVKRHDE